MHRIAALIFAALVAALPAAAQEAYPSQDDHPGRALCAGRRQRLPGPHPGRRDKGAAQGDGGGPELPGAGSAVGSMQVAKAKPDGYTLLLNHIGLSTVRRSTRSSTSTRWRPSSSSACIAEAPMLIMARRNSRRRISPSWWPTPRPTRKSSPWPPPAWAVRPTFAPCCSRRRSGCRSPSCSTRAGPGRGRRARGSGRRALRPADHDVGHDPLGRTARLRPDRAQRLASLPDVPTSTSSACRASVSAPGSASMRRSARPSRSS